VTIKSSVARASRSQSDPDVVVPGGIESRGLVTELPFGQTMLANADEREATVLFADLRGFTAMAENRPPVDVLRLVNRCFAAMVGCVRAEEGMLDKFLGDGLMAVFGIPEPCDDHAARGLRAAHAMQLAMADLAPVLMEEGWGQVGLGVGLESGRVVAGHVGVPDRHDYTVLGDVVNVAARLTAGAAAGEVVLGPGAGEAVGPLYPLVPLGNISIRGRRAPVLAWRLAESMD
jgi:adenylate cyclase